AQRFPGLAGREIKSLLIGSATDLGFDPYAQGAGLVNVSAAVSRIVASLGTVSFGRVTYPHQPVSRTVTYTNLTDQPITLSLSAKIVSGKGTPGPDGLATVTPSQLTLPAKGTSEATLTLDGRTLGNDGIYGRYLGTLTATDGTGAVRATDRISALLEAQRHETTIRIVAPDGATDVTYGGLVAVAMDDQDYLHDDPVLMTGKPSTTIALYAGVYAVGTALSWRGTDGEWHNGLVILPEVTVAGPTPVTIDLRQARQVAVQTPEATETNNATFELRRTSATGKWALDGSLSAVYGTSEPHWWTLPTKPVSQGTFRYINAQVLVPPLVTMRALGNGSVDDLHPRYVTADRAVDLYAQTWGDDAVDQTRWIVPLVPHLPAKGEFRVVYAGNGTATEMAGAKVRGAVVLLTPTDICDTTCPYSALQERIDLAAAQGAVGVIVGGKSGPVDLGRPSTNAVTCSGGPETCPAPKPYSAVPVVSVPAKEATALAQRLRREVPVMIQVGGEPDVPKVYALSFVEDHVPAALPHRVGEQDLDPVVNRIHGTRPGMLNSEGFQWARAVPELPRESEPGLSLPRVATGQTLTMLVGPRRAEALDRFKLGTVYFDEPYVVHKPAFLRNLDLWFWPTEMQEVVVEGRTTLTWNSGPMLPGTHTGDHTKSGFGTDWGFCAGCREGDRFWPAMSLTSSTGAVTSRMVGMVNDSGAGLFLFFAVGCEAPTCSINLYDQAGKKIAPQLIPVGYTIGAAGGGGSQDLVRQLVTGSPVSAGR
ncbi:MAG TPA: hypothetical protein VFY84_17940, partial [Jiangellales bacterium]|nr:hypothetical protein [Jiangellales bacterium]